MPPYSPYRARQDLVNRVLKLTGVESVGQPTDPEDYNEVDLNLDSWLRKLAADEIVFIPDPNNIPGAFFEDLAAIIAGFAGPSLGLTGQALADLQNNGLGGAAGTPVGSGAAARSLKQMQRARPTGEVLRVEYF